MRVQQALGHVDVQMPEGVLARTHQGFQMHQHGNLFFGSYTVYDLSPGISVTPVVDIGRIISGVSQSPFSGACTLPELEVFGSNPVPKPRKRGNRALRSSRARTRLGKPVSLSEAIMQLEDIRNVPA
jgi:hypothetical protein